MNRRCRQIIALAMATFGMLCINHAQGAGDVPSSAPPPAAPSAPSPFEGGGGLPSLPSLPSGGGVQPFNSIPQQLPALGGLPSLGGGTPDNTAPGGAVAVPTPPPLTSLVSAIDTSTTTTSGTTAAASGPIDTYEFLFREDDSLGPVREKYPSEEAQQRKNQEIQRLIPKYQTAQGQGGPQGQQGQDPRAGAEWDFYYEQLDLYSSYVRERVLAGVTDLPEPKYDAANYIQEANDLKDAYNKAALTLVSDQYNENRDFYDRLDAREDKRRNYYEWLASQQRNLDDWAKIWERKVDGNQWAGGVPVRRDDWYQGTNVATHQPVAIEVDNHPYVLSDQPQSKLEDGQLNVITTNLTPYDLIDRNGVLKTPEMERLRGSIVLPPASATTGTVEMAN